jgi:hypothetical protein
VLTRLVSASSGGLDVKDRSGTGSGSLANPARTFQPFESRPSGGDGRAREGFSAGLVGGRPTKRPRSAQRKKYLLAADSLRGGSERQCVPSPSVDLGVVVTDLYALGAANVDVVLAAREPGTFGIWG